MGSIAPITKALKDYIGDLKLIKTEDQAEFKALVNSAKKAFIERINDARDKYPETIYLNYPPDLSENEAKTIVERIAKNANTNYSLPILPSDEVVFNTIMKDSIVIPSFMSVESENKIVVDKQGLNDWVITLLMSMPAKSVKLTIVDTEGKMWTDYLYANLHKEIYGGTPIIQERDYASLLERLNNKMIASIQKYDDVVAFNEKQKSILSPYEVIIFVSEPKCKSDSYRAMIEALSKNGKRGGIFMVHVTDYSKNDPEQLVTKEKVILSDLEREKNRYYPEESEVKRLTKEKVKIQKEIETYNQKYLCNFLRSKGKFIVKPTPISTIPALLKCSIEYLNKCAAEEVKKEAIKIDLSNAEKEAYKSPDKSILVPVGKDGQTEVNFTFDLVGHVHSFVLGQSGSGKSVFLHNVISGLMLNYSPKDIELYLLDFKLGGVEFNRYQGEKHVHAMLVDNTDSRVTLEILRELKGRMLERGRAFRKVGTTNIAEYNQQETEKLPHIVLVADECHELFSRGGDTPLAISSEINEILTKIAKEGRNQGVHLLMATQTLSGTEISNEILANITDHYLLKCSNIDSEKLVPRSSDTTSNLTTGNVLYSHSEGSIVFQAYFTEKSEIKAVMKAIEKKSAKYSSNMKFSFNGSALYSIDDNIVKNNLRICKKCPVVFIGKSIDLNQTDISIALKEDISENILVLGLNDEEQTTRVSIDILQSLLLTTNYLANKPKICIVDCLQKEDGKYQDYLDSLNNDKGIELITPKERSVFFKNLAEAVNKGQVENMLLFIIGQDKFRELKLNYELDESSSGGNDVELLSFGGNVTSKIDTFNDALNVILDKGPELGVHTVMQLEKASNFLFNDYLNPRDVYKKFRHLILLKSDAATSSQLHLDDEIRLEQLCKDEDRLRAYYYSEESDEYRLFTPYIPKM